MTTIFGGNTSGGYEVDNSVRLFSNTLMTMTPSGAPTNADISTLSFWTKLAGLGANRNPISAGASGAINFRTDDQINFYNAGGSLRTTQKFKDVSAWYHIVLRTDTTDGTANDRLRVYVNGTQVTDFAQRSNPDQNANTHFGSAVEHHIGCNTNAANFFNGYLAEVCFIDGLSLGPDSFGEFDGDSPTIWKPINVSGLTYGNNGFYLEFKSGGNLGDEDKGTQTADWSETNLTAVDQSTDTCTNNFATMNPLDNHFAGSAFSEGNCKIVTTNGNITYNTSTIGFSSGKWYMETKLAGSAGFTVGVVRGVATANDNDNKLGNRADGFSYDDGGAVEGNGGDLGGSFATYEADDIIGVYADLDNNELYFSKNGALQNSGTGLALTAGTYFFAVGDNNSSNSSTYEVNFGNPVSALSSAVSDGEYGAFEYSTTITGDSVSKTFKALNTKNLAEFG